MLDEGAIRSALDRATRHLASNGRTETPRLDAEVLLAFVLGWSRARLFAHWDAELTTEQRSRFDGYVARRAAGEPVAYIRNLKEFLGLELYVDPRVLIPRPETELLVTHAIAWLGAHPNATVVDVGTGSGAVSIGILASCPSAHVIATDTSAGALEVARLNAARHRVSPELRHGSLLEPLSEPVDLIVANLPYLSQAEYEGLLDTSIAFEPREALTDDGDGLRWYHVLLAQSPPRLSPGGAILLEIGAAQAAALPRLAGFESRVYADYAGWPRVLELSR